MAELNQEQKKATKILCDNKSIIFLTGNTVIHNKSKYTPLRYHYTRELISNNEVEVNYCGIDQ